MCLLALVDPLAGWNDKFLHPFIDFNSWKSYRHPFIYLKPEKGIYFGKSFPVFLTKKARLNAPQITCFAFYCVEKSRNLVETNNLNKFIMIIISLANFFFQNLKMGQRLIRVLQYGYIRLLGVLLFPPTPLPPHFPRAFKICSERRQRGEQDDNLG